MTTIVVLPDLPDNLPCLPDDVELAQVVHDEVDEVGEDGEEIHQVHGLDEEGHPLGRARQPHHVLNREEDGREGVHPQDHSGDRLPVPGLARLGVQILGRAGLLVHNVVFGVCAVYKRM